MQQEPETARIYTYKLRAFILLLMPLWCMQCSVQLFGFLAGLYLYNKTNISSFHLTIEAMNLTGSMQAAYGKFKIILHTVERFAYVCDLCLKLDQIFSQ